MSDEGFGAALVFGSPALLVGSLAAWWAWRGYAVRYTPPVVVAVIRALFGGALTFVVVFAVLPLVGKTDENLTGQLALLAALIGALVTGVTGFVRQRRFVESRRALITLSQMLVFQLGKPQIARY